MFAKLLKHEFRAVRKSLGPLSLAALLSSVVGYILMLVATSNIEIENNSVLTGLSFVLYGGIYIFLLIYVIGASLSLYVRFYKTKFTDEGYLTFTLPASTHQILLASIVNMIIWFFIIIVIMIICILFLIVPLVVKFSSFSDPSTYEFEHITMSIGEILLYVFQAVSSISYSLILPLLSITLGSLFAKKHKLLASFGIGYGINMAVSFLSSILTIAELTANELLFENFSISISVLIISCVTFALSIAGYFLMHHLIKNKLNI